MPVGHYLASTALGVKRAQISTSDAGARQEENKEQTTGP
jgi:hypothetical protein